MLDDMYAAYQINNEMGELNWFFVDFYNQLMYHFWCYFDF